MARGNNKPVSGFFFGPRQIQDKARILGNYKQRPSRDPVFIDGASPLAIVGSRHFQKELGQLALYMQRRRVEEEVVVELIPQPDNPHDPNAVGIHWGNHQLGFLPRGQAKAWHSFLSTIVGQNKTPVANLQFKSEAYETPCIQNFLNGGISLLGNKEYLSGSF